MVCSWQCARMQVFRLLMEDHPREPEGALVDLLVAVSKVCFTGKYAEFRSVRTFPRQ